MKYRNKKSGTVIDVQSVMAGDNWELVEKSAAPKVDKAPTKRKTKKVDEEK